MRFLAIIILLTFVAAGAVLGALNADMVNYDLGFIQTSLPKGAALLVMLVIGWLLGGLTAWLGVSAQRRRSQRKQIRADKKPPATA